MVDRVSGYTKWIQHWTVLADWYNTRADRVVLLLVAGRQLLGQVFVISNSPSQAIIILNNAIQKI